MLRILFLGICAFALYAVVVATSLVISIVTEFSNNESLSFGFCLSKQCIEVVSEHFSDTIEFYKSLFYMIVPLAGLFAGVVGLSTYKLAISNSIVNNHISNFKLFCDFVDREIEKRKLINPDDVDFFTLYLIVFPKSKKGVFNDFSRYEHLINEINGVIQSSNNSYISKKGKLSDIKGRFNYKYHQYEMKDVLDNAGFNISINHRNAFFEVEEQIMELIRVIGKAFVYEEHCEPIIKREYL
ncbi:TPA: hypothetical protein I7114_02790 [Vibrio vulnificus]|uniref:retron Ec48 family effector membrane protein n=1 Tax=Vibrio vulnificus TaxID=672 RepID=UPI0005F22893|nr:retron Ec48 family effector membrane protein [Vibrio vulnificus]OJI55120.1 hypothetical protein VFL11327_04019 [Vibrio fluvialis]ELX8647391.1 retron Ec48 family effector membrane protein [Vibrio vulnificus]MCG6289468.1 retron Ec48 family effector membrane protein [Vibrio vulnificus]MCU8308065.1 retron Ec48 family effector membrane protein [Vibrio vulnificus]OJI56031.1 hypothetical protein VV1062A_01709 [Vibrio vulnificus]